MLTIYIDFKSPESYLAIQPTLALLKRLGAAPSWRPFCTTEAGVPPRIANETKSETHRRVRAEWRYSALAMYAEILGTEFQVPAAPGNTDLALGALANISGDPAPFILAAFNAYWRQGRDLNDAQVVAGLVEQSSVSLRGSLATAREALPEIQRQADDAGVVNAPGYVIGGQVFVGREHLPWITQLLTSTAEA